MKAIARYKITYPDYADGNGTSQFKYLINHEDFVSDIKPKYIEIASLEAEQTKYKKKNDKFKVLGNKISEIKSYIKGTYGDEFFTTESPLYLSQSNNGLMTLSEWQGGEMRVVLEKLN